MDVAYRWLLIFRDLSRRYWLVYLISWFVDAVAGNLVSDLVSWGFETIGWTGVSKAAASFLSSPLGFLVLVVAVFLFAAALTAWRTGVHAAYAEGRGLLNRTLTKPGDLQYLDAELGDWRQRLHEALIRAYGADVAKYVVDGVGANAIPGIGPNSDKRDETRYARAIHETLERLAKIIHDGPISPSSRA